MASKLQQQEDAYLLGLNARLDTVPADGPWDWPTYGLTFVSGVVLGWRHYTENGVLWAEAVYSVTVGTKKAVPNVGLGKQDVNADGSRFTFIQPAKSVAVAGGGFETELLSRCVWVPPPKAPAVLSAMATAQGKNAAAPLPVMMDDSDDPPGKPHPP